jgi:hypothetical protein
MHGGSMATAMNPPWLIPLFEDIPIPLDDACGDKGFDSEKNQRYVKERHARSFIDVRSIPKRGRYRKQVYRRKQRDPDRWKQRYRKMRNCIESKNASVKHRFGDFIPGKNIYNRRRYLIIRAFSANLMILQKTRNPRSIFFIIFEDFYSPPKQGSV